MAFPWHSTGHFVSGIHLTIGLWAHCQHLMNIFIPVINLLMIPSGSKFAHIMSAELLWHVEKCDLIRSFSFLFDKNTEFPQDWDYELKNNLWNGPWSLKCSHKAFGIWDAIFTCLILSYICRDSRFVMSKMLYMKYVTLALVEEVNTFDFPYMWL